MALTKHKGSDYWYFRFSLKGKVHFGSTKTTNRTLALKIEREKYNAALAQLELGDKESITIKAALDGYAKTQESSVNYKHIVTYISKMLGSKKNQRTHDDTLVKVYGFDGGREFHTLDDSDVQKLILHRRNEGNANSTIMLELVHLSKCIKMTGKLGYAVPNINFRDLKSENNVKPAKKKLRYLSVEEEQRLLTELDPSNTTHGDVSFERGETRDVVIILLGTGARYSEIAQLKWADVSLQDKALNLYRSKVHNESILSMTNRVFECLTRRFANKRPDQIYVFENSTQTDHRNYTPKSFNEACERAGIEGITLHSLRKTFTSRLVQAGMTSHAVSKLLGHSTSVLVETTYGHLSPNQASKSAVEVLNKIE